MRLFTGLDLPADVAGNLERALQKLRPAARITWSKPENLHITTKFIGEWPEERLDELKRALVLSPRPPIDVTVRKLGFYPNERVPRVFWCGVESPGLPNLAEDTDQAMDRLGIAPEIRAYSPHLTLARIKEKQDAAGLMKVIQGLADTEFGRFAAGRFFLYQSRLQAGGSVYTKLAEFPFYLVTMLILAVVIAYILGAIPFGYLLVKWKTGGDVRASGSGNIGATNVLRTTGRATGIATLLLDIGKGYLAVWIAGRLTNGSMAAESLAAIAVMAGHAYPVFLKFKGGKAVASFVGAFLCLTPVALAAVLVVFVVVVAWTRHISMGSIVGAATFPLAVWLILKPEPVVLAASLLAGGFIIYKHRSNIERLHAGTEHEFTFGARKA